MKKRLVKKSFLVLILSLFLIISSFNALAAIADHVVISEVYYDAIDEDDSEFVELYNPTDVTINISGWIINDSSGIEVTIPAESVIPAHGFFLIADGGWSINKDNPTWPNADVEDEMGLANIDNGIVLKNGVNIVDSVGWGSPIDSNLYEGTALTYVDNGNSSERKSGFINDESEGNGWDTNNNLNDFITRTTPQPQNSSNSTEWDITPPTYRDALISLNTRSYIDANMNISASVNATDNNLANVTCRLNDSTTAPAANTAGDIYNCSGLKATSENDFLLYFDIRDTAGNLNITTALPFTTKHSTTANLTTQDITVSDLNQSDKIVEINITFNNKGSSTIYNPNIILDSFSTDFAEAINKNITCADNLSVSQSCNAIFNVTIFGGTAAGTYRIFWKANWTNNNFTYNELTQAARSYVTINSNPQMTVANNRTATISHNTNQTLNIYLNSTGNSNLQNVNIAYNPSTLQQAWVTISPSSFTSISAATNETFNVTVAIPSYTSPGNYTGTLTITATSAETKTILLRIEVPQDSSWNVYPDKITTYKRTDAAGLLGTIYVNNTGNVDQTFSFTPSGTLYFYVWDNSNPTSGYVSKGATESFNFNHLDDGPSNLDSYTAQLTIKGSESTSLKYVNFNLTRDDDNPNINITAPLNNSFVKGLVEFNVSASDLNLSNILFYINNDLVFDDTEINYTYNWNTLDYSDDVYTLKAIAYDSAGNYNLSEINVTVNNTDSLPILKANIPAIKWDEDSITNLTLSLYFKTIDGDSLKYNFTPVNNITVNVNNATQIANFTPDADFFGTRYIKFYAIDSSNNITPSNNITLTITNINDAPSAPTLLLPLDTSTVFSIAGRVTLNWSQAIDPDNDVLTYYVLYGNNTNVTSSTTTQNTYLSLSNLNNATTYYWRVYANDGTNNSANSSRFQFTVTFDDAPVIINFTPTNLTPSVAENSTLEFTINASDPDSGLLNYSWYLDNIINKTDGNNFTYTPDFTASGTRTVMVNITDNNSNFITQTWTVTVTNTNRAPALDTITDKNVLEDSILTFNITASDADGDTLSYTSNQSSMSITKINNTLATVSWKPTNEHVGNNTITFTVNDSSLTNSKTIIITVNNTNDAPTITYYLPTNLAPTIAANTGSQLFNVTVVDVDDDVLSYVWYLNGTSVSTTNSYTASSLSSGTYNVTIIVNDSSSTTRQSWTLNSTINIISTRYSGTITSHTSTEENATGVTVDEPTYGTISFLDVVNLSNAGNIDDYIEIRQGVIAIDTSVLAGLNRSASIIMKGLNYTKAPLIYYNGGFNVISGGTICNANSTPSCTNKTYDIENGILTFNIEHFSTYYAGTNTTNGAPVITSTPETTARAREPYTYDVDATDPDGDPLTYSLTTAPSGMSISSSTGLISWEPTESQQGMQNVTVEVSDNNLTDTQSFSISVAEAKKLRISDLDVKVNGKSDKNLADGDTISREAKPESDIEFKIEVENGFTDEEDLKIEDIFIEIIIRDIDDGDNIDKESKEFDLRPGKDKRITLDFKVPLEVDEDVYDVDIHIEGEDENGTTHEVDWTLYLEVEKEKHDIKIVKAALNPSVVKCEKAATLNTEIINLGRDEEEEVVLEIISPDLGISFLKEDIELEEGTEDNRYSRLLSILIPDNLKTGIYPIEINSYYDTIKLSDTETVNLEIQECKKVVKKEEEVKAEPTVIVNVTKPAVKPKEEITKITFRESPAYVALLATLFVIATGVFVFALGVTIILLRRK